MLTLVISVNADAPLGTLDRIRKGLEIGDVSNPGPLRRGLSDATDRLESYVIRRFDALSMGGGGGEWAPLAPSTVRQKLATGRGVITTRRSRAVAAKTGGSANVVRILVKTRALRESLESTGKNHIRQSIPNGYRTGSKDPKIRFHQDGTANMPARKVYPDANELPTALVTAMAGDVAVGVQKLIEQAAAAAGASASP